MIQLLNFNFHPKILIRTPALPFSDFTAFKLADVLLNPDFQQAILLASRELYDELSKRGFIYEKLGEQLRTASFKYYNRMSYRPTPFGAFASVSLSNWVEQNQILLRDSEQRVIAFQDFSTLDQNERTFTTDTKIYLNPSMYKSGDEYRYHTRQRSKTAKRDAFRIMKIPKSKLLKKLFIYVKVPVAYQTLIYYLENELEQVNAQELVAVLVKNQILYHSHMPAIIRDEFPLLPVKKVPDTDSYAIAFHTQHGGVPAQHQQTLQDGLWAMNRLSEEMMPASLMNFIKKFTERFDAAEIPLLRALDPQTGISYLGTEKTTLQNDAPNRIHEVGVPEPQRETQTSVSGLMLRKLVGYDPEMKNGITLTKEEISALGEPGDASFSSPPSLSVTFRLTGKSVFIENAGGSSAVNIAGRFSHDSEVLRELKYITAIEQQQNPDVIFAEIAGIDHSFTDNINTRGHLRDYEIPVLTHSELPAERIIYLKDLTIQVTGNRLLLRCRRLNKEVIPRLGTAYNYSLSNLPLFRFLGDLQYQGLKCNLSFDPELLVPSLNHYPRISYKNCILSAAKWVWDSHAFMEFTGLADGLNCFLEFAIGEGLPRFFVLADFDRELVFDLTCASSISYFLTIIRNKTKIVLKEYFVADDSLTVRDESGRKYASQMVAFLINQRQVYDRPPLGLPRFIRGKKTVYLPGGDWCYFKVYAHQETLNILLRDPALLKLISGFCKIGGIRRWFFVRYADPHPHLRIRFRVADNFGFVISGKLTELVQKYMENNLVSELVTATYEPELERYGLAGMRPVELIFQRSSELVLAFHKLGSSTEQETCFAVRSVALVLCDLLPEISDRLAFVSLMAESVSKSASRRVQLDQYYRLYRRNLEQAASDPQKHNNTSVSAKLIKFSVSLGKFQSAWRDLEEVEGRKLMADLIHMHMNRLNASGWVDLETASYYLLCKFYRSFLARACVHQSAVMAPSGVAAELV